jgi:hypothetical protein
LRSIKSEKTLEAKLEAKTEVVSQPPATQKSSGTPKNIEIKQTIRTQQPVTKKLVPTPATKTALIQPKKSLTTPNVTTLLTQLQQLKTLSQAKTPDKQQINALIHDIQVTMDVTGKELKASIQGLPELVRAGLWGSWISLQENLNQALQWATDPQRINDLGNALENTTKAIGALAVGLASLGVKIWQGV